MSGITIGNIQKKIADFLKKIDLTDREIQIERNLIIENTLSISLKEILLIKIKKFLIIKLEKYMAFSRGEFNMSP